MPLAEGDVFAGYTIVRKLGAGGMGEVYLVQHPRLPRYDALKILPRELTIDHEYRERFNREADVVARLWHPHIVGVHDRGEFDGQLWITMDFVEGTDAARMLADYGGGLPPEDVVRIVSGVADALDYAHQQGLLHRDVKPSNILLAQTGSKFSRVMLADFGIARWVRDSSGLTATDMTVGTVAYAAPEQLMGQSLDGRADQYALAATAFHLLAGQQLFQHDNPAVVISNHLTASPPSIGERIPELSGLGFAFERALAKSPADRFDTCTEFAEAMAAGLSGVAQELGATDRTVAAQASGRQPTKHASPAGGHRLRNALLIGGAAAVLVGVAIAAGVIFADREKPAAQRPTVAQPAPAPPPATAPAIPVVRIGADCDPLGAAGVATTGQQAYCSSLPSTGDHLWSIYSGPVPDPTVMPGPNDEVYPPGIEEQVRVCVSETGKSRIECRNDIRDGNLTGPA
ncbi:serine/threonine protein kinase [Mycolicibacterium moriokaense]|uniref:non-specific serine/threonine protein kinase n=1 Tax=Mycolicibacterium moriokaense TaxID=39691 RepID=A0AAD1HFT8_9MYCO|nr:serine/threonine-protein kinase [Mycolicibacterium moriokaense]MCV7038942.1 serine/threonine protein kinase [Mycolicibacterium moriokaense]ORB15296.1 serine/threonine protein kinase [Mycolicibacterium moriokaense]BBX04675.1 serine/threonine-protein kinase PknF [Mycolicibacterium moriokaense]